MGASHLIAEQYQSYSIDQILEEIKIYCETEDEEIRTLCLLDIYEERKGIDEKEKLLNNMN